MTPRTSTGPRPWFLGALVAAVALGAAALAFFLIPARYSAQATALLGAPKAQVNSDGVTVNPYGDLATATARLARLTAALGNGDSTRTAVRSQGGTAGFTVSVDAGAPLLTVRASGSSADAVVRTARVAAAEVGTQIAALQSATGVPVAQEFLLRSVASPATAVRDDTTRAVVAGLVFVGALLVVGGGVALARRRSMRTIGIPVAVQAPRRPRLRNRSAPAVRRPATLANTRNPGPVSDRGPAVGRQRWEAPLEDAEAEPDPVSAPPSVGRRRAAVPEVGIDDTPAPLIVDEPEPAPVSTTIDLTAEAVEPPPAADEPALITSVGYEGRSDLLSPSTFTDAITASARVDDTSAVDRGESDALLGTSAPPWQRGPEDALAEEAARAYAERFPRPDPSGPDGGGSLAAAARLRKVAAHRAPATTVTVAEPFGQRPLDDPGTGPVANLEAPVPPVPTAPAAEGQPDGAGAASTVPDTSNGTDPEPVTVRATAEQTVAEQTVAEQTVAERTVAEQSAITGTDPAEPAPAPTAVTETDTAAASGALTAAKRKPAARKPSARKGTTSGDESAVGTLRSPRAPARHQKAPTPRVRKATTQADGDDAAPARSRSRKSTEALVDNVLVTEGRLTRGTNGTAQQAAADTHEH